MKKKHIFDEPKNVKRLLVAFFGCCFLLLCLDPLIDKSHAHFPWEAWIFFNGTYGFVGCVLLVLAAKHILRPLVRREEDYYE